jgi:hypothetical protein
MGKHLQNKTDIQTNLKVGIVLLKGKKCKKCQFNATSQKLLHHHNIGTHSQEITTNSVINEATLEKIKSFQKPRRSKLIKTLKSGIITFRGLKCTWCNFMATGKELLVKHNLIHLNNITSTKNTTGKPKEKCLIKKRALVIIAGYNCSKCQYWATSPKLLDDHVTLHCASKLN